MKVFIAGLVAETNSFSPIPLSDAGFAETTFHGDATRHPPNWASAALHVWRRESEAEGREVVESLCAYAQASGITARKTYERLRDEILRDLRQALPVDLVLLSLHGAMVAHGYDDCEGDLLARVRSIVGIDAVIGTELDLHCTLTPLMLEMADVIITYKENPHTDVAERADELYALCVRKGRGEIRPVTAIFDTRMVGAWRSTAEPMASFVRRMKALEGRDGVLSVSFAYGFAFTDVPHQTAKVIVICDSDKTKAATLAEQLGREVWQMREQAARTSTSLAEALDRVQASNRSSIVLADISDNAGGGAPSDSTYVLSAILERGIGDVAIGMFWDPGAVRFCMEAGEGATLDLRIGGKCGKVSGQPVDLTVTVERIVEDASVPSFGEQKERIGDAVWVRAANRVDLVLASFREQTYHPDAFTQFGIDLAEKKVIVVKSSIHFGAAFEPLATEVIYAEAGGLLTLDYRNIPFRKFKDPYWPKVADPFTA